MFEGPPRKRRRTKKYDYSDDFSDSNDGDWKEEDSSEDEKPKRRKYTKREPWQKEKPAPKKEKSRQIPMGQMAITPPKQFASEITGDEKHHSPGGEECEFIEFEKLRDIVLKPKDYLKNGQKGINTFVKDFKPNDPDKLKYFGYESNLVTTDITAIRNLTDEQLDEEIENIEKEIERYETIADTGCTIVPAFDETIQMSVAIKADVRTFPFDRLGKIAKFDVITMDPPWQIALSTVTRGVAISYDQLDNNDIQAIPLHLIQDNGYIFVWVIACQLGNGINLLKKWGYDFVTYLNWVKVSKYGRYMPSHGYYLQHNKETCLVGRKGKDPENMRGDLFHDLIVEQRGLRQSHKPVNIYELIERVFPDSMYMEIFARPHNLRNGWVSMGIELPED